jgi:cyclophilin family peptidyl-prolyl cis-trans isomerase
MAAFAIGLIGDRSGRDVLIGALNDEHPLVKGSAAEGLGLIGDASAADAIGRMATQLVTTGAVATIPADEEVRRDTPAAALRLALVALARLKAYPALASVVLDEAGQPRVRWWPVAFALQRVDDARAKAALLTLARDPHPLTRAFAVKGLGGLGAAGGSAGPRPDGTQGGSSAGVDPAVVAALVPLVTGTDPHVAVEAIRALGLLGDAAAGPPLIALIRNAKADPLLRLEAVQAAAAVRDPALDEILLDTLADPSPAVRGATLRALAHRDPTAFITILSGLDDVDADWRVRAALAETLGTLSPEAGLPRLRLLLEDRDQRVVPAALTAFARLAPPDAVKVLSSRLIAEDPVVRAAAARALASLKPAVASPAPGAALAAAYTFGQKDTTYVARAAALDALADLRVPEAAPTLTEALSDKDWAVRVRAAELLARLDPASDAVDRIRPAPTGRESADYRATRLTAPAVSTQFFVDTDHGTIHAELAVLDAPLTVDAFVTLARRGFYDGVSIHRVVPNFVVQGGDPRGDGEGGPGFTIRDEPNQRSFVRGMVGMALDWRDTGGSQFFITQSPQPHLDAMYTAFARVLSGMEVVDRLQVGDVIRRIRIWDGTTMP